MSLVKALVGEFLCTLIFIFTICANSLNESRYDTIASGAIGAGVSTAFVAVALIYAFGDISGAHFNSAVTIGAMAAQKMHWVKGTLYILAQHLAGLTAVGLLMGLFGSGSAASLVLTPFITSNVISAIFMELLLTFFLVFIIFAVALGVKTAPSAPTDLEAVRPDGEEEERIAAAKARLNFAPIAIGLTLGFLCFLGGNVSGGGFNPVRATAPAILSLSFGYLYIYWIGSITGAVSAAVLHTYFFAKEI